jgi:KaiC/GvpD/RAD55 family RecA-like ATPase
MSLLGIVEELNSEMKYGLTGVIKEVSKDRIMDLLEKTYKIIGIIIDSNHEDVKKKIRELDLKARMEEIEGFFNDIKTLEKIQDKQSVKNSLASLHEIVEKIHNNLNSMSTKIVENNNSWFAFWKWSSIDFNDEVKEIDSNEKLLTIRYNRVKDLLKIIW